MLFWLIVLALVAVGGWLVYMYGWKGAIAAVTGGLAAAGAWLTGMFGGAPPAP